MPITRWRCKISNAVPFGWPATYGYGGLDADSESSSRWRFSLTLSVSSTRRICLESISVKEDPRGFRSFQGLELSTGDFFYNWVGLVLVVGEIGFSAAVVLVRVDVNPKDLLSGSQ